MYPEGWPRCVCCGDYALDGHFTCGRSTCSESQARDDYNDNYRAQQLARQTGNTQDEEE